MTKNVGGKVGTKNRNLNDSWKPYSGSSEATGRLPTTLLDPITNSTRTLWSKDSSDLLSRQATLPRVGIYQEIRGSLGGTNTYPNGITRDNIRDQFFIPTNLPDYSYLALKVRGARFEVRVSSEEESAFNYAFQSGNAAQIKKHQPFWGGQKSTERYDLVIDELDPFTGKRKELGVLEKIPGPVNLDRLIINKVKRPPNEGGHHTWITYRTPQGRIPLKPSLVGDNDPLFAEDEPAFESFGTQCFSQSTSVEITFDLKFIDSEGTIITAPHIEQHYYNANDKGEVISQGYRDHGQYISWLLEPEYPRVNDPTGVIYSKNRIVVKTPFSFLADWGIEQYDVSSTHDKDNFIGCTYPPASPGVSNVVRERFYILIGKPRTRISGTTVEYDKYVWTLGGTKYDGYPLNNFCGDIRAVFRLTGVRTWDFVDYVQYNSTLNNNRKYLAARRDANPCRGEFNGKLGYLGRLPKNPTGEPGYAGITLGYGLIRPAEGFNSFGQEIKGIRNAYDSDGNLIRVTGPDPWRKIQIPKKLQPTNSPSGNPFTLQSVIFGKNGDPCRAEAPINNRWGGSKPAFGALIDQIASVTNPAFGWIKDMTNKDVVCFVPVAPGETLHVTAYKKGKVTDPKSGGGDRPDLKQNYTFQIGQTNGEYGDSVIAAAHDYMRRENISIFEATADLIERMNNPSNWLIKLKNGDQRGQDYLPGDDSPFE